MFIKEFKLKLNEAGVDGGGGGADSGSDSHASFDSGSDATGGGAGVENSSNTDISVSGDSGGGEGVVIPENWKESLAQELRDEPSLANVPDVSTLVKNYVHAQKQMGKKGVHLPDKHSTDDDRRSFFQQLGLPAALEEYELSLPDGAEFEDGFVTAFKQQAYEANILPEQSNALLKWYAEANANAVERLVTQNKMEMQDALLALKKEWGSDYDNRKQLANNVLRHIGDEGVHNWIRETGLEDSADMIKLMSAIGEMMREDRVVDVGDNVGPTHKELNHRIQELENNFSGPLYDKKHPNHAAAVKERDNLYRQLYPEPS